jgi:hypothetical protein
MPEFVPSGYLSIRDAVNRLGRKLFESAWTGEEHRARRGLISEDEWARIKDLPPARGSGAMLPSTKAQPKPAPHSSGNPSDPLYQAEYEARKRYVSVCSKLRASLERGDLEAVILDPFTGTMHGASASLWRRHDADRIIERGQASIPGSPNTGQLLVKQFAEANESNKPIPHAKIQDAIEALKQKTAAESLTRPQQKDFLRKTFASYRLTERQLNEIFRAVPVPTGRPRKSDK